MEYVTEKVCNREQGYFYFVTSDGRVARSRMKKKSKGGVYVDF